ncbi:MAG: hypothetical protein V4643_00130 [Bacteroidota bacterium]
MKILYTLISLFFLFHLFSSCSTDCPDNTPTTNYVDQAYLPDIIPYSDTSTRRFLKNGSDTLVFTSQGLKETFESGSTLSSDCQKSYKNQQFSLKMAASDTDFFELKYRADLSTEPGVTYSSNNILMNKMDYSRYLNYLPWRDITVLNNFYDSISISKSNYRDSIYSKKKLGVIRIKLANTTTYELIP